MCARFILSAVIASLISMGISCGHREGASHTKISQWAMGSTGLSGGVSVFIRTLDRDVKYFVIFDAAYLGMHSIEGGAAESTPFTKTLTFSPSHLDVPILDEGNGESLQIGPTTYALSKGKVFLCRVRQDGLTVEQVGVDLSGIDAQDPSYVPATLPYPNAMLAVSNLAKRDYRTKDFMEQASKAASRPASTSAPATK